MGSQCSRPRDIDLSNVPNELGAEEEEVTTTTTGGTRVGNPNKRLETLDPRVDPFAINRRTLDPTSGSLYEKQRFLMDIPFNNLTFGDERRGNTITTMAQVIQLEKEEGGHLKFNIHGSFSSGARRELLQLLVEEVTNAGGNFTAAHIANASNWQEVWGGKLKEADRTIVVFDEAYKARFTGNCKWEHDLIYNMAVHNTNFGSAVMCHPICVHFVDDATLENPKKLRAWLGNVVKDNKECSCYKVASYVAAHMDSAALEAWHMWCMDPSNRVDLDALGRQEALREIETQIKEGPAAIKEMKNQINRELRDPTSWAFVMIYYLKLREKDLEFLKSNLNTWRDNVAARDREDGAAAAAEPEDLGFTTTGAVVTAFPRLRALVQQNKLSEVLTELDNGADINEADTFHMTAAHYAAQNNFPELLQILIERGANVVDAENKFSRTPIFLAAGSAHMNIVAMLKAAGAKGGDVVSTPDLESALIKAAKEGDESTLQTMIENGVVNLNAGDARVRA